MRCAIVTVSDTRTPDTDGSGTEIQRLLQNAGHEVVDRRIVRDDPALVRETVVSLVARGDVEAVITNGGTGIAARDNTYEAVAQLLDKRIDGFGELFRMLSFGEIGAAAMLSRAVAGVVGSTALLCVPGSTAACRLAMEQLILPQLGHMVALARPPLREGTSR
ncbi:MAG: MogA/MoaB family molybdenum cofactor biosynthesis protein [Deltaproteobacteria bacterium]|nr:MogA/MoaB family molybdenum cofactor biosynthesis protein [Deltaproteobacteria bacterium]